MLVDAPAALEGRTVRFVIEHSSEGAWTTLAETTAPVRRGGAVGLVAARHPAERHRQDLHFEPGADPAPQALRFQASVV
jgi:hypothetical protein